jgi:hypothetical protein
MLASVVIATSACNTAEMADSQKKKKRLIIIHAFDVFSQQHIHK